MKPLNLHSNLRCLWHHVLNMLKVTMQKQALKYFTNIVKAWLKIKLAANYWVTHININQSKCIFITESHRDTFSVKSFSNQLGVKSYFLLIHCISFIAQRFRERLQPIFRHFANLIKHCIMQQYSRWNRSNHILSQEKITVTDQY